MVDENNTPENKSADQTPENTQNPNATETPASPNPSEAVPTTENSANSATETKPAETIKTTQAQTAPETKMFTLKLEGLIAGEKEFPSGTKLIDAAKAMGAGTPSKVSYSDKTSGRDVSFNHVISSDMHLSTTQKSSGG